MRSMTFLSLLLFGASALGNGLCEHYEAQANELIETIVDLRITAENSNERALEIVDLLTQRESLINGYTTVSNRMYYDLTGFWLGTATRDFFREQSREDDFDVSRTNLSLRNGRTDFLSVPFGLRSVSTYLQQSLTDLAAAEENYQDVRSRRDDVRTAVGLEAIGANMANIGIEGRYNEARRERREAERARDIYLGLMRANMDVRIRLIGELRQMVHGHRRSNLEMAAAQYQLLRNDTNAMVCMANGG